MYENHFSREAVSERWNNGLKGACSRLALTLGMAAVACIALPVAAQAAPQSISIAAGPLDAALLELATRTGISVFVPPALVAGKTASSIEGTMTPDQALGGLLRGSGLSYSRSRDGTYVIVRAQPRKVAAAFMPAAPQVAPQSAATAAAAAQAEPQSANDDIIVTAQKRAENIQDVPATIAAFSREALENRQVRGLGDLTTRIPSLQVGYTFGSSLITLRGISTNLASGFEDPSVAVHVNGVYQARARSLNLALMDLERVEVLSGPQGTLYGRNATGGVINYILRGPTEETEAEVTGSVGNYDSYGLRGYISGPINDKVGFRIAGMWDNRDKGFTKNLQVGAPKSRFEENHVAAIRGVLEFNPTDTIRVDLEGSFSHTRSSFAYTALEPSLNPVRRVQLAPQTFRPHEVYSEFANSVDTKEYAASATINWDVSDNVQVRSISAYQAYRNQMDFDPDTSGFFGQTNITTINSDSYTQEINLITSSFNDVLKSTFGIFYFNDKVFQHLDLFFGFNGPPTAPVFVSNNRLSTKSIAFFTDQTLSVTDSLRLIGGIRYNSDKKHTINSFTGCPSAVNDQKFEAWTPRAGVQFDVTRTIMAYATYQKGFKAGGVGAGTCGNAYEPETIEGGEAGVKMELVDGRIRLNLAGYWYKYGNLQVQKTLGTAGGFTVLNAADSKIKGIEANLSARIVEGLRFDAAAMVQSAKYTDFINCDQTVFLGACGATDPRPADDPTRFVQVAGNWLNRAPPYSISTGLEYTMPIGDNELLLRGESYWSGRVEYTEFNTPVASQRPYNIQNAFATMTLGDSGLRIRAFIKNIGNVQYKAAGFFTAAIAQYSATWMPPRTYGAEVSFRF